MTDTLLLKTEQLKALIEHLEERNSVIRELSQTDELDANKTARFILAFWLGNSVLLSRILSANVNESELIRGYLCVLELDKKIGQLMQLNPHQQAVTCLRTCQLELLLYFNSNYSLFNDNPNLFFAEFKKIIQKIDSQSASTASETALLIESQKECLTLLSQDALNTNLITRSKPHLSSLVVLRSNLTEFMVRKISVNYNLRLFVSEQSDTKYSLSVQLIQGNNGILLEGLLIENRRCISDTIVLAQIARTPFQSAYFKDSAQEFGAFFGTKVLLLNHRNYSSRFGGEAQRISDLAQDVFDTAMHFHKLKQKIVLYGMCGGVPHTVLAAYLLRRNNIPFKLIVDRFATDYSAFRSSNTLIRQMYLQYVQDSELCFASTTDLLQARLYLFAQIIYGLLIYLVLALTRTNINGAQIIRLLPSEDVLLLQARAPKKAAAFVDFMIHPTHEMRRSVKDRRHSIKAVFKNLIEACGIMKGLITDNDPLQKMFMGFSCCFHSFLKLIDDEKLTFDAALPSNQVHDLHGAHLYQLATRSGLPLKHYVRGFFAAPTKDCMPQLNQLHSSSKEETLNVLKKIYQADGLDAFSDHFSYFLSELVRHKVLIGQFANRAFTTNQMDMTKPLQYLLDSELYTELGLINGLTMTS
ncbi:MAG: hypothetical protein P4L65_01165 [Legionella sp.]|nr:hypothetical protein [Legionella sp.]